ncbi:helix-turn-helix domain-containing protein [Gorillibacterium sp. sgz5001074]|uniref:helix-turn-helix domain-containing protein n=1 Tax=Gorillibacterium sp. sgz5001074 TaxID=3446695 RepID=UPI003F67710F
MQLTPEQAYNEKIAYENPFMSVRVFELDAKGDGGTKWHYHKELEIIIIRDGLLELDVEDDHYTLQSGDVVLIGAKELHRDRSFAEHGLSYIVFQFDIEQYLENSTLPYYRAISDPGFPLHRLNYIFRENPEARRTLFETIKEIQQEVKEKREGYEMAVSLLIKRIVLVLLRGDSRKLIRLKEQGELLRMKPVLDYVEAHLDERIQVEDACRVANVSYFYFVKYFKKVMGMSFLEYVNYKKIKKAERILLTQDVSVAQAAESIGMPNMAHFYKVFKKINQISPNEYRKKRGWNA